MKLNKVIPKTKYY